jgi:hypothetical protein
MLLLGLIIGAFTFLVSWDVSKDDDTPAAGSP